MNTIDFDKLYEAALAVARPRELSSHAIAGGVGCALAAESANIYTGVCIDAACSVGFCAEHAAIAAMVTAGENRITHIVAVNHDGEVLPPCGRCREFISQVHTLNRDALVMYARGKVCALSELLPHDWKSVIQDDYTKTL